MVVDEKFLKDAGLIMEPQFNLDKYKPGTALHIKGNGSQGIFYSFNSNCLVVKATPLLLTVSYIKIPRRGSDDEDGSYTQTLEIPVEKVSKQEAIITFLNEPKPVF